MMDYIQDTGVVSHSKRSPSVPENVLFALPRSTSISKKHNSIIKVAFFQYIADTNIILTTAFWVVIYISVIAPDSGVYYNLILQLELHSDVSTKAVVTWRIIHSRFNMVNTMEKPGTFKVILEAQQHLQFASEFQLY